MLIVRDNDKKFT